jgi:hypothetical protein
MHWFDVDKEGLGKILEGRGPEFIGRELVQNALDEETTRVEVSVEWEAGVTHLTVRDDSPDGFTNLSHAWTLFAESKKKGDPTKRGRFNLGEKLVLALCHKAIITTTTGTVIFDKKGRRKTSVKQPRGSVFEGWIRQPKKAANALRAGVLEIIPPGHIQLFVDNKEVVRPDPVRTIDAKGLETEAAGSDGVLRRTKRNATLVLFEPSAGEPAVLHEMGIPVVELAAGDRWHVDVSQKVPLTMDRDNVRPAYLRRIRTLVINATHELLEGDDANAGWAREALKDPDICDAAVQASLELRFGEKRVAYDPSDPEANQKAMAAGYTVVTGSQLSKEEWASAKRAGAMVPAGQVTPSSKVRVGADGYDPVVPEEKWTPQQRWILEHAERIGTALLEIDVRAELVDDRHQRYGACFGAGRVSFNRNGFAGLGKTWFNQRASEGPFSEELNWLLIHEFGHHFSGNHLDSKFHDALCRLGAKLARLAVEQPSLFIPMETPVG